jgi:putative cell wall-binding protein
MSDLTPTTETTTAGSSMTRTSRSRRPLALLAAAATGLSGLALLAPATSSASSHREAPYTATDPEVDGTDVYAFVSPEDPDTVTLLANYWPFEEPDGGPNFYKFYDGGRYEINVDNDGDARADLTYRWTFSSSYRTGDTFLYNTGQVTSLDDTDLNFRQTYDLELVPETGPVVQLLNDAPVAPSNVGPASMPDYAALRDEAVVPVLAGAGQAYAGQADDPFFLDLRVFDLLYGGNLSEVGNDTLNGRNVQTIAVQVPAASLALGGNADRNPVIGVWSTASKQSTRVLNADGSQTDSGDFVQVSRLGNPLVNEVVVPVKDKDLFNRSTPVNDGARFLSYVQDPEVPRLIEAIYGIDAPDTGAAAGTQREDLVEVFLTGVCASAQGCPATVGDADLNSQLLNQDVAAGSFVASEQLRLNVNVPPTAEPNRLGVIGGDPAGFPNGRRLQDDVIDIALQVVEGELVGQANDLGDAVDSNDLPFSGAFPYVALPHNSAVNESQFLGFERLAGQDRYGTAAAVALDTFDEATTAVIASGRDENLADALTGSYLAGQEQAPILLVDRDTVPAVTRSALQELGVERVVILGQTGAVSQAVQDDLARDFEVERIGGRDRYETAALIATSGDAATGALLARGDQFADALVAGPIAYRAGRPILLTPPTTLSASAADAFEELGTTDVVVLGGTSAVSAGVVDAVEDLEIGTLRLQGVDRRATAVAVARYATGELGFDRLHVALANGSRAADALAGGPRVGVLNGVLLLTADGVLGTATEAYLAEEGITLETGDVLGGGAVVPPFLVAAATEVVLGGDPLKDDSKR